MKANQATAEVFFTAFKAMEDTEREAFIEKVVKDPSFKENLIGIALIEDAKIERGRSVPAKVYLAKRAREKTS